MARKKLKLGQVVRVMDNNSGHGFSPAELVFLISPQKKNGVGHFKSVFSQKMFFLKPEDYEILPELESEKIIKDIITSTQRKGRKSKKMSYQFRVGDHVKLSPSSPWFDHSFVDDKVQVLKEKGLKIDDLSNRWINNTGEDLNGNYCYSFQSIGRAFRSKDLELVIHFEVNDLVVDRADKAETPRQGKVVVVNEKTILVHWDGETEPVEVKSASVYLYRRPSARNILLTGGKLFESIVLPEDHISAIKEAVSQQSKAVHEKIFNDWGFGEILEKGKGSHLLFYGPPGTGKTLAAEAVAQMLSKKMRIIGVAEIESSEPGGAERAIKAYFAEATKSNLVLVFDECDSLIYHRAHVGMILAAQINCLLSEMERFDGVCIYTTNNTPVLDPAFERRLSLKLAFEMPKKADRLKIWARMFPVKEALSEEVKLDEFAEYQIAGGTIKNIVLNAARHAAHLGKEKIEQVDLKIALEREQKGAHAFGSGERPKAKMKAELDTSSDNTRFMGGL